MTKFTAAVLTRNFTATAQLGTGGGAPRADLAGEAAGGSIVAGALTVTNPADVALGGAGAGVGASSGNLTAATAGVVELEGTTAGQGASSGDLSVTAPTGAALGGTAGGQGASSGDLATSAPGAVTMGGSSGGQGAGSGDLTATAPGGVAMAGTGAGAGGSTGDLTAEEPASSSGINSVTIMDATALDATGAYGDATSRTGVNGNGWVAKIEMPLQIGQTFDPTKLVHTISDPGYDASTSVTRTRDLRGTVILRRQYNAAASKQQSDNGVTVTIYYALEDLVYAGSTLSAVTAEAGYYGSLAAGTVDTLVNNSTRPYYKPLAAWLNMQHDRSGTSGMDVEIAVAHAHGMNGQMVARVEFIATDASSHTAATQTASAPSLSSIQTQGNLVEAFKATIPLTALTQGDLCQVNAKVYPWIGDASAVLDLAADGFSWPTANPQTPLRFLNDKNATYGGAIAYVRASASGGTVSRTDATARANPFPTIAAALTALATFNNTNSTPAHNDHSGGTIYLMDNGSGGAVAHTISATISTAAGECWTDIRKDPAATGAVSLTMSATRGISDKLRWFVDINHTAGNGFDGGSTSGANKMLAFGGGTITNTTTVPLHYRNGLVFLANCTVVASANRNMLAGYANTRTQTVMALGVTAEGATADGNVLVYAMIGCRLRRLALQEMNYTSLPSNDEQDGMFIMNNWFRQMQSSGTLTALLYNHDTVRGKAIIQNVFEQAANATGVRLGGDGATSPADNVLFFYNTVVGGRLNVCYTDVAAAAGVTRRTRLRYNLIGATWNCKTDTFTTNTTVTGRVGNWENIHNVGNRGNVVMGGSENNSSPSEETSWLGTWWREPTYNVGAANVGFTDDKSTPIGSGALGGTYSLTGSSNAAYDRVEDGESMLKYDIAGTARRNNGTGASGCYERTVG